MAFAGVGALGPSYDRTEHSAGATLNRTTSRSHYYDDHPNDNLPSPTDEYRNRELGQLARSWTRRSQTGALGRGPSQAPQDESIAEEVTGDIFAYEKEPDLDPFSNNFDAKKWTKLMFRAHETTFPSRKAGLSFKDLGVFGYGSDAGMGPLHKAFGISLMDYYRLPKDCR